MIVTGIGIETDLT